MAYHVDIFSQQLIRTGEEVCGDTVQIRRGEDQSIAVLSDGLGSGIKARILSTLTARIIVEMLAAKAPIDETVRTVVGTLPVCQVRQLAYATFTAAIVDHDTGVFQIFNFDNPRVIWLRGGRVHNPPRQMRDILGRQVAVLSDTLVPGDFIALISDGVLHAGLGRTHNLEWNWEALANYLQQSVRHFAGPSRAAISRVMRKVWNLYGGQIGDDCSIVGIAARQSRMLSLFTGPPLDEETDESVVQRFLARPGRHVVCGGTTGNIVGRYLDELPETDMSTMRPGIPPIARMREIDLLTEGILTMSRTLELLRSAADGAAVPQGESGDILLARELTLADHIHIIMGQRINDSYQSPDLPPNLSLRKSLVDDLVQVLRRLGKQVTLELV